MSKTSAEIREYLKSALSIRVDVGREYGSRHQRVTVQLMLDGVKISEDSASLPFEERH